MSMSVLSYKILQNEQTVSGGQIVRAQKVRISCICDTAADLPAMDYVTLPEGTLTLAQGSRAFIIANSSNWILNGAGIWVETVPPALADTYSKQQIDNMFDTVNTAISDAETRLNAKIDANTALLATLIDNGAKNIMPIRNSVTTETKRGVTAVYDFLAGTVTLNGTHDGTGDAIFYLYTGAAADATPIPAGTYHLSGCPAGGSTDTFCLIVNQVGGSPAYKLDTGSGQTFTIADAGHMAPQIRIRTPAGQTVSFDNVIFRPMICLKSYYDISPAFAPYCPTLPALYAMIQNYHP